MEDRRNKPSTQLGLMVGDLVRLRVGSRTGVAGVVSWVVGHNIAVDTLAGAYVRLPEWDVDKLGVHQLTDEQCAALMRWKLTR